MTVVVHIAHDGRPLFCGVPRPTLSTIQSKGESRDEVAAVVLIGLTRDTWTQVSKLYTGPFPFRGALDKVVIRLTD